MNKIIACMVVAAGLNAIPVVSSAQSPIGAQALKPPVNIVTSLARGGRAVAVKPAGTNTTSRTTHRLTGRNVGVGTSRALPRH
jgi:hypothetical protein